MHVRGIDLSIISAEKDDTRILNDNALGTFDLSPGDVNH